MVLGAPDDERPLLAKHLSTIVEGLRNALRPRDAKIVALEQRISALESRPSVQDAGTWECGVTYNAGDIVSHHGSGWICRATHYATGDDLSHEHFRLLVKHGKDAR